MTLTHFFRSFLVLTAFVCIFATPSVVKAGCPGYNDTTTPDNASGCSRGMSFPATGKVTIFSGDVERDGYTPSGFADYWKAIVDDFNAHHDPAYSWSAASYSENSDLWGDFYFGPYVNYAHSGLFGQGPLEQYSGFAPYYTYRTAKRVCQLIAGVQGSDPTKVEPSWEEAYTDDNASSKDNLIFDGSVWRHLREDIHYDLLNNATYTSGSRLNAIHHINKLRCVSSASPAQSLLVNGALSATIKAGEPALISYNSNNSTGAYGYLGCKAITVSPSYAGFTSPGTGPTCHSGSTLALSPTLPYGGSGGNIFYTCTGDGTGTGDVVPTGCAYVGSDAYDYCVAYSNDYNCDQYQTEPATHAVFQCSYPPLGSFQVSPPASTTPYTFTYSCTNDNGTTPKTVTLTVGAGSYPILSVGSINASNVAIAGVPERFAGRVYQSIRSIIATVVARIVHAASGPVSGKPLQLSTPIINSGVATQTKFVSAYFIDINNDSAAAQPGVATTTGAWDLYYTVDQTGLANNTSVNSAVTVRNTTFSPPGGTGLPDGTHGIVFCADWYGNVSNPSQPIASRCTTKTIQYVGPGTDITASAVTSSVPSPVANQSVTLSTTITNGGTAATSGGFPDLFEINPNSIPTSFASIQTVRSYSSAALPVGGSAPAEVTYAFPSAGVWYVRACANTDTSGNTPPTSGGVGESDYSNNCGNGSWTSITVGSGTPSAPTATLSPATQTINSGQKATFTWSSTGAVSCKDVATPPAFDNGSISGTSVQTFNTITQPGTNIYQLLCTGATGLTGYSNQASVTVLQPGAYITASPRRVIPGQPSTISWSATDVTGCNVKGTDGFNWSSGATTTVATTTATRNIATQTKYTIDCTTTGIDSISSVVVNVLPSFREF